MENSRSEAIFDSLNLNPNLFINEALNLVDDVIDGAFDHFQLEASKLLGPDQDVHRSAHLEKDRSFVVIAFRYPALACAPVHEQGVAKLKSIVQSAVDKRLNMWERYCMAHCFSLPEGFSLPKDAGLAGDNSVDLNIQRDRELDEELDSLRNEIASVVKETTERNKELCAQKRKSELNSQLASSVDEASQLFEQHSDRLEELKKTAAELREKMEQQSKRFKLTERSRIQSTTGPTGNTFRENIVNGLSNVTVEELEEFIADISSLQTVI